MEIRFVDQGEALRACHWLSYCVPLALPRSSACWLQPRQQHVESDRKGWTKVWVVVEDYCEVWSGIASRWDRDRGCRRAKLHHQRRTPVPLRYARRRLLRTRTEPSAEV